jgi:hypothetical protein
MPPAAAPSLARRALAVLAVAATLVLGLVGVASAQEPPPTTVPSSILVPGTTAPTTTPPATTAASEDEPDAAADEDDGGGFFDLDFDANEKVWIIVAGLVAIAILMLVLTVIYWRHTKPDRPKQDRRIDRAERRAEKSERKDEKRRRKAAARDPFVQDDETGADDGDEVDERTDGTDRRPDPSEGPMDLDGLLARPDPSRSVFGAAGEDDEPSR